MVLFHYLRATSCIVKKGTGKERESGHQLTDQPLCPDHEVIDLDNSGQRLAAISLVNCATTENIIKDMNELRTQ